MRESDMTGAISDYRVRYAELQLGFFESIVLESQVAGACAELEVSLSCMNRVLADYFSIDHYVQDAYFEGLPHNPGLDAKFSAAFGGWLTAARKLDEKGQWFERNGHAVAGIEELRTGIGEVAGALNPSYEMGDALVAARDAALDEHRRGTTLKVSA